MIVLSHRGWWRDPAEKNSWAAFNRALDAGFGLEVDVRDQAGDLVIAHDPPVGGDLIPFSDLVDLYRSAGQPGALAVNIKADGLRPLLPKSLTSDPLKRCFFFDMSTPEAVGYLAHDFAVFTRHSELEPHPAYYDRAAGVWMDGFDSDWVAREDVEAHLGREKAVALVSPELHGRDHGPAWKRWAGLCHENLMVCTDYPDQAAIHWSGAA